MRALLLVLLSASVATSAQDRRPIQPGDVLTVDATAGQTVFLDLIDHAYNPGGYYGMRLDLRSPSDETLYVSPTYVFNEVPGRTVFRIPNAEPGRWTATITGERVEIEGALWATATPPALTLHEAAAEGDLNALRASLPSDAMERLDLEYQTALMLAAKNGHADAVRILLDAGANVHATAGTPDEAAAIDPEFEEEMTLSTPLHFGANSRDLETVRALLDAGADPNAREFGGSTPLHSAVYGSPAIMRLLLDSGADPSLASDYRGTPAEAVRERIASTERMVDRNGPTAETDASLAEAAQLLALLGD